MRKILFTILVFSFIFILAACGGDDNNDSANQDAATNNDNANTLDVSAKNFEFDQEEYTVQAGEPVTINFTAEEGMHGVGIDEFDVVIQGDGTATFTPDEPGEYRIYCNVPCGAGHSDMYSTLVVQ